jgi:light-regulated signal transduction histidine kinase (bacteriophytochrome)
MAAELEFTNKELEAFSYSVSHDLRAPFRHISGFAELLLTDEAERLSERGRRYVERISQSAQFAGQLVDSLLNFSRIARTRLETRPVAMTALVKEVWDDVVAQELQGRTVEFTCGTLPTIEGDVQLLRQVWRNLLSNAAKYTRGRNPAQVNVTAHRDHANYIFAIHDNGVGFDNRYVHKLFGAFQRLHRAEEFEGTGIGLANVRRIIARHGGQTWAEGKLNEGASFYFSLPVPKPTQA